MGDGAAHFWAQSSLMLHCIAGAAPFGQTCVAELPLRVDAYLSTWCRVNCYNVYESGEAAPHRDTDNCGGAAVHSCGVLGVHLAACKQLQLCCACCIPTLALTCSPPLPSPPLPSPRSPFRAAVPFGACVASDGRCRMQLAAGLVGCIASRHWCSQGCCMPFQQICALTCSEFKKS